MDMAQPDRHFLTQHTDQGVVILTFTEPMLTAAAVNEAVAIINSAEQRKVVLDCQSVRCLVSGSLYPEQEPFKPLLNLRKQLAEAGGRLVLCSVAPDFADVLRITRLDRLFEIRPDVSTAVACLTS